MIGTDNILNSSDMLTSNEILLLKTSLENLNGKISSDMLSSAEISLLKAALENLSKLNYILKGKSLISEFKNDEIIPKLEMNIEKNNNKEIKNENINKVKINKKSQQILQLEESFKEFINTYCGFDDEEYIQASIFLKTYNKINNTSINITRSGITMKEICKNLPICKQITSKGTYYVGIYFKQNALDVIVDDSLHDK